jgi:hypothetical protein
MPICCVRQAKGEKTYGENCPGDCRMQIADYRLQTEEPIRGTCHVTRARKRLLPN